MAPSSVVDDNSPGEKAPTDGTERSSEESAEEAEAAEVATSGEEGGQSESADSGNECPIDDAEAESSSILAGTKRQAEAEEAVDETADDSAATAADTAKKIDEYLHSRTMGARFASGSIKPLPRPPPKPKRGPKPKLPPDQPERKHCYGVCRGFKTREEYSSSQWSKPKLKQRFCLMCTQLMPPAPLSKRQKTGLARSGNSSSFQFGNVTINDNDDLIAQKPAAADVVWDQPLKIYDNKQIAAAAKVAQKKAQEEGLPPELPRNKGGDTPCGRIRSCMCAHPAVCRDLMWRWARLNEGKYINYLYVPHASKKGTTPVGQHVTAYREAVLRNLGYNDEGQITRTVHNNKKEMTSTMIKGERVSMVHFHPDVIPYILHETRNTGNKINRWRMPNNLGKKLGLKEEDKCPTRDSNDEVSYFVVPTYSMEQATADVERAENEYKRKFKAMNDENEAMTTEMASNPLKYAFEIHGLKKQNDDLRNENKELLDRLKREKWTQESMEKKMARLEKGLVKMTRRLDRYESGGNKGRKPKCSALELFKETTGEDITEEELVQKAGKGKGGKRWSDSRMDIAVEAKWQNSKLSSEQALIMGGYEFPLIGQKGIKQTEIMDLDNVSLGQRKNQLLRRLRSKRKMVAEGKIDGRPPAAQMQVEQAEPESEAYDEEEELGMATVDDLV